MDKLGGIVSTRLTRLIEVQEVKHYVDVMTCSLTLNRVFLCNNERCQGAPRCSSRGNLTWILELLALNKNS